jgi:hypothetical protein
MKTICDKFRVCYICRTLSVAALALKIKPWVAKVVVVVVVVVVAIIVFVVVGFGESLEVSAFARKYSLDLQNYKL